MTLRFGQTPWDDMPREQLIREVQRMYSALVAARSVLAIARHGHEENLYWRNGPTGWGSGGRALTMTEQALAPYPDEPAYRSFFRYANDLLFEGVGSHWAICPNGDLEGSFHNVKPTTCSMCKCLGRGEVEVRPITWDDLKPETSP